MNVALAPVELRPPSEREFVKLRELVYRESGIFLSDAKRALLAGRLGRRLRELGLPDFDAYHALVATGDGDELTRMLDCICTNETRFFREPQQFEFLESVVFPEWRRRAAEGKRPREVKAWSAACSTGEEPYSLAMSLAHHLPAAEGWTTTVLASDLSTKVLKKAIEGVWPLERAADVPERYLKAFMQRGIRSEEGKMRAGERLRSMLEFRRVNLSREEEWGRDTFDLIFCRNVLIYFDGPGKNAVIERLLRRLGPGGLLFLGHAESLNGWGDRVRRVGPTVYAKSEKGDARS